MTDGDQGSSTDAPVSPSKSTSPAYPGSSMISPSLEYPRVLLAISLRSDGVIPDVQSCIDWLKDAPVQIQKVDVSIEAAFDAHSTLILVSMPVEVWTYLPKVAAYRFIDFICSSNLLPKATSEQQDEETQVGSVKASSVSTLVEGKHEPSFKWEKRMLPSRYLEKGSKIVFARHTQSLYDKCRLQSVRDIRVLVLRPGQLEDPIECILLVWSLTDMISSNSTTEYEALSHCYNPADSMRDIIVYTQETTFFTSLKIRPELYAVLQRLRHQYIERHLWVDAICINSEDTDEKNSQVTLMPEIFHHASNVCIWLGPASEDSPIAIILLNSGHFGAILKDHRKEKQLVALASFMRREWFRNRWSFQVLALARRATLYCGGAKIDWSDFAVAVSLLKAAYINSMSRRPPMSETLRHVPSFLDGTDFLPAVRLLDVATDVFRRNENEQSLEKLLSLEDLVCICSEFETTTPHDVIYSMLALANDVVAVPLKSSLRYIDPSVPTELGKEPFIIDYDMTFVDVCKEFLMHTIRTQQSLDIICRPWVPQSSIADNQRPSWLITTKYSAFRQNTAGEHMRKNANALVGAPGSRKTVSYTNYHASKDCIVTPDWRFGSGVRAGSMYVEGFVIDSVKQKEAGAIDGTIPSDWMRAGGWDDATAPPPDQFWRTLVADRDLIGQEPPKSYRDACKAAWDPAFEGGRIITSRLIDSRKGTFVADFARRVQEVIWARALITTERDLLGLAPLETKEHDLICILYGCSVPVVLRMHSDDKIGDEYFEFIGECYVNDLMDGEALSIQETEEDERRKREGEEKEKESKTEEGQVSEEKMEGGQESEQKMEDGQESKEKKEDGQESEEEKKKKKVVHSSAKRTFELR